MMKEGGVRAIVRRLRDPWFFFSALCVGIAVLLIILPILKVAGESLRASTGPSGPSFAANYAVFFTKSKYLLAMFHSLKVVVYSSVLAALVAVPLAYLLSRYTLRGKNAILTLITMATASPPFLGAYAWVILMGRYGAFNRLVMALVGKDVAFRLRGENGVVWVIMWLVFPLIFLLTYDSFTGEDSSHREASMGLGANRWKTFWHIELPLAAPGLVTGLLMAALAAFSDFGTPSIIGGEYTVLPTLVYGEFVSEMGGNLGMASTAGIVMVVISTLALMGQRLALASKTYASVSSRTIKLPRPRGLLRVLIAVYAGAVLLVSFLPHMTLLVISLMKWKWGVLLPAFTFENYAKLISSNLSPIGVSFLLGGVSTFLNVVFGIGIAYLIVKKRYRFSGPFLNFVIMIPYVIPGIVLAVGFIIMFNKPPIVLTGTAFILILAYFIRKLPYSVKSAEASLYQIHPALEEAAMMCGARPFRAFRDVTLKLMIGGVISGATLSFLQIMTELSTTIILYRTPWVTMPIVIFQNAMTAGADFGVSAAMGVVLMACIYIPLAFINRKSRGISYGGGY
jgi:iron(III) transport system permease protein